MWIICAASASSVRLPILVVVLFPDVIAHFDLEGHEHKDGSVRITLEDFPKMCCSELAELVESHASLSSLVSPVATKESVPV